MEIDEVDEVKKQENRKLVLVLLGKWVNLKDGAWDFIVEENCMSQCISITDGMTYSQVRAYIEKEFELEGKGTVKRIAYRMPTEMSAFRPAETPPVSINSDNGLATFMEIKAGAKAMNLFVTFEPRREMQRLKNGGCINIHEGNIIRLSDSSPSFSSASLSESGKGSDNRTGDDARYAANDDVQEENQIVQYVYPTQDLPRDRCGVIDLNNIYGTDMIVELEKVEALAKEAQGFPSTSKGKQKLVQINNDAQTPSSNNGYEPYATAEEVEYNYDYWNALITKEYGIGVDVQSLDVGETSNYVRPPTDAQEERQNFNIETVVQESSGHDDGQHTKSHDHLAIQSSLANIYNDILEGDSLSAPDCEPCFGDQLLQSEDMESRVFDPANDAIYIGRVFRNKVDMQTAVAIYAIKRVFNYKQVKSDKERVIMKCVDDNCHWRVYGHVVTQGSENIQIRTARLTHTCSVQTRSQFSQNATSKVVAQVLRSKYTNGKPGPRAVDIPAIVLDEMHVSISYMKGWHAKEKAITQARGTEEGSYNLLMRYLEVLKATNEGTLTDVVCTKSGEEKDKFKYLFFALGACIKSVDCMRKVLIVDATAIKAKFKGTLITASFQDCNFQIMPVAFGVVDGENDRSWSWFFCRLATIVPDAEDLVIVSDRQHSIYSAIRGVYSLAKHGACAVHLTRNVKARFRKQKGLTLLVSQAAFAYTIAEFQKKFKEIEARSPLCATYLKGICISHWTRAYFQGKRYNIMSSNVAECLNAALANALELPIVTMVDAIRMMIMRWFYERRTKSYNHAGTVTPEVEKMLVKNLADSAGLSVFPATNSIFQINSGEGDSFSVDLERRSCTCRVFDTLGIPCRHAMAAARVSGIPVHAMVDDLYKTKNWQNAYINVVMPVPNAAETDATNSNENYDMLPPVSKQLAGRPRKRRIPSAGENMPSKKRGKRTCSRCGGEGHNRATCTYGIP